eukprot:1139583-Pelagomonas_calceolata.AAC.3
MSFEVPDCRACKHAEVGAAGAHAEAAHVKKFTQATGAAVSGHPAGAGKVRHGVSLVNSAITIQRHITLCSAGKCDE